MKARLFASTALLLASGLLTTIAPQHMRAQEPVEGVEVLTRGPVHEAFAEPITLAASETILIEKEPPQPIEELPPDVKPEGENVLWIPGYWAWDDEREDFLWISGVWRNAPPGQEWVPGYWSQAEGGYHWTPGFWASTEIEEVSYLPQPPETIEEGPSGPQPSADHFWVPGVWRYRDYNYVWRPGYWHATEPDWVWMPAHYVWCPSGYVYVDGYWDYPLARRGVLFAPVYFTQAVYTRPSYYYSPSIVINTSLLSVHLFTRPRYCHYYFGDYYGSHYAEVGYYPWFSYHTHRHGYDPLFVYDRWHHGRRDRGWERGLQERYEHYRDHEDDRPVHTFAALRTGGGRGRGRDNINFAVSLNQVVSGEINFRDNDDDRSRMRFERLEKGRRDEFRAGADRTRRFAERRIEVEGDSNRATRDRSARQSLRLDGRTQARIDDDPSRGRGDDRDRDGNRGRAGAGDAENRARSGREQFGDRSLRGRDTGRDATEGETGPERERGDGERSRDTARTGDDDTRRGGDSLEDRLRELRSRDAGREFGRSGSGVPSSDDRSDSARDRGDNSRTPRGLEGQTGGDRGRNAPRVRADDDGGASDFRSRLERDMRERVGRESRGLRADDSSGSSRSRIGGRDDPERRDTGAAAAELQSRIQREMRERQSRERASAEDRSGGDSGRLRFGGQEGSGRSDIRRETSDVGGDRSGSLGRPDIRRSPLEGSSDRSGRSRQSEQRFDGPDAGAARSAIDVPGSGDLDRLRRRGSTSDSPASGVTVPGNDGASLRLNRVRGGDRGGSPEVRGQVRGLGDMTRGSDRGQPEVRSFRAGREGRSDAGIGQGQSDAGANAAAMQRIEAIRRAAESRQSTPPATSGQTGAAGAGTGASTPTVVPNITSGQDRGGRGNDGRRGRGRRD